MNLSDEMKVIFYISASPEFWGRGICESLRVGEPATVYAEYPKHVLQSDAQRFLSDADLKIRANNRKFFIEKIKLILIFIILKVIYL